MQKYNAIACLHNVVSAAVTACVFDTAVGHTTAFGLSHLT